MARRERPRRICIAPVDVASYYSGLRQGFVELGVPCWLFSFDDSAYSRYRPAADAFWLERWVYAVMQSASLRASRAGRVLRSILAFFLRVLACVVAAFACDVFIFAFGFTFLRGTELPFLRLLRRKIVFVFNGSDTRPAWMSGIFVTGFGTADVAAIVRETTRQRRQLRWLERWASMMLCHPLSAQLLRRPFFNHLQIGHPCAPSTSAPAVRVPGAAIRLLHAPTRPVQKGSARFRTIVETLRREGRLIDFEEVTGRPNREVLAAIAVCDFVLDETYSDIPLAGLGSEAAFAGRPAVVGGYGAEEIMRFAAGTGLPMETYAHPDALEPLVRRLVDDPAWRTAQGEKARDFLIQQWTPRAVATRFLQMLTNRAPRDWLVDPATLTYWQGWGASEEATRRVIVMMIERHGVESLGVSHIPALETRLRSMRETTPEVADAETTVR